MISALIYLLCSATCAVCALLLLRSYRRSRMRLLLWSGLGFAGFTVNNVLLFLDRTVYLQTDLSAYRTVAAVAGIAILLFGLIWES